jgi:proline iminopeptidase
VDVRTGYVPVPSARLFLRDAGSGTPVVVLHGGPDFDHSYLVPEIDVLAARARVLCYDQRGRGRSAVGVQPDDVSLESELDDLERVRTHLGLESFALLGHSWGAVLAAAYAARHARHLTRLVLVNAAPTTHDDTVLFGQHVAGLRTTTEREELRAITSTDEYQRGDLATEVAFYRIHFRHAVSAPDQLERLLPRLRRHFTPETVLLARAIEERLSEDTWASPAYDLLSPLRDLAVPTLVLHGEHDHIPLAVATHTAEAIPGARLVVLPGCGHFAVLEQPEAVAREVTALLAG